MLEGKEIVILLNSRFQRLSSNPLFVPFRSIVNLLHRQLIIGKRKYRIRDEIKRIERTPSVLHLEWNSKIVLRIYRSFVRRISQRELSIFRVKRIDTSKVQAKCIRFTKGSHF